MISIVITTYGDDGWIDLAWARAYPSTMKQGAQEVIVKHFPDLSIGPARNAAAAKVKKPGWLCFLDADDELEHGYIDAMKQAIENTKNPEMTLFQPAVRYIRKGRMQDPYMIPAGDLRHDNYLVVGTVVHQSLFKQVGGFEDYTHGFEDWSCWAKCWKAGATVTQVPRAIYNAHINPRSVHRQLWRNRKAQVEMHMRVQKELFPE